jgi:hypothetical protein
LSDKNQASEQKAVDALSDMSYKSDMRNGKPNGQRGFDRVTFRPTAQVREQLRRLNKVDHAKISWAINSALAKSLPAVLERIGA